MLKRQELKVKIGSTISFRVADSQALGIVTGYQPIALNGEQWFGSVHIVSSNGETKIDERRIIEVIDNGLEGI